MTQSKNYRVGFAKADITPPEGVPYLAFAPRHSNFEGVIDPLYIRAVTVDDGNVCVVLLSLDLIGLAKNVAGDSRDFTKELKDKIAAACGMPPSHVLITCPHIHSAPETAGLRPLDQNPIAMAYLERLKQQACDVVAESKRSMFEADLRIGIGCADGLSYNRRGEDCLDTELTVLWFESVLGNRNVLLANFACHPVIMQVQEQVTADFPGAFIQALEHVLCDLEGAVFLQGACADIDPMVKNSKDMEDVKRTGYALAAEAVKTVMKMKIANTPKQHVLAAVDDVTVEVPSRATLEQKECAKIIEKVEAQLCQGRSMPPNQRLIEERYWHIKKARESYLAQLQAIRIGDAILLGIPGEPFCEMGLSCKRQAAPLKAVPVGYANDYLGYIAPEHAWQKGGYEVSLGPWSKTDERGYEMILQALLAQVERLKRL